MMVQKGKLSSLRKGRRSIAGSPYFVTAVIHNRKEVLNDSQAHKNLMDSLWTLESRGWITPWMFVLMPDHFHGVFVLDREKEIGDVVGYIKGRMTPFLRKRSANWQKNFVEHRIRSSASKFKFLRYVLSNPYKAGICQFKSDWPYTYINDRELDWFIPTTDKRRPFREWLLLENPLNEK